MSTYSGKKVVHQVGTTMDRHIEFACDIGLSGSATALSASVIYATDGGQANTHVSVSGTSPGKVIVTIDPKYVYPRMVAFTADLHPTSVNADTSRGFSLQCGPYVYPWGSQIASGSQNAYSANPTVGGGAQFIFQIVSGTTQTRTDPVEQTTNATGSFPYTLSIKATFKNRGRDGI